MPRPKGSKNRATIAKEFATAELRRCVKNANGLVVTQLEKVVNVVIQQALDGCRQSQKMLLDRGLPILRAAESERPGSGNINITINGMELPGDKGVTIDGEKERVYPIPSAVSKTNWLAETSAEANPD